MKLKIIRRLAQDGLNLTPKEIEVSNSFASGYLLISITGKNVRGWLARFPLRPRWASCWGSGLGGLTLIAKAF
jgi:hypothetical protein